MKKVLLKLNEHQQNLLAEVLSKRGQLELIDMNDGMLFCTSSNREKLRQFVLDEFCETGLREDDEPNNRGLELEDLIDAIGRW